MGHVTMLMTSPIVISSDGASLKKMAFSVVTDTLHFKIFLSSVARLLSTYFSSFYKMINQLINLSN